jgi:hypothetical protein
MAVTRKARHPKRPTQRLVEFLNFSYTEGSREAFLQKEIRRFVLPLLLAKSELIEFHLERLVAEINRIGLRPYWVLTPAAVASGSLRFGERHLRIQNTQWVVSKVSLAGGTRESVFQDIIYSIEAGDFGLLRRCPICQTFFVAKDFRQAFCGSVPCKRKRDNDTAKDRVAKKRDRERRAQKILKVDQAKTLLAANELRGFEHFCDYMTLRGKKNLSQADQDQLWAVTRHLPKRTQTPIEWDGQIKKGVNLKGIWESFSLSVRSVFLPAAHEQGALPGRVI